MAVREKVTCGLERLLLCEVFAIKEADVIVRSAVEKIRNGSFEELTSFRLVITSTYVCKWQNSGISGNSGKKSTYLI